MAKKVSRKKPAVKRGAVRVAAAEAVTVRTLTFLCTVKSESADSMHLFLNGEEVSLEVDGDTASGKASLAVGASVKVKFRVGGLNGTEWSVEVAIDCPDGPVKIVTQKGTIAKPGGLGFEKDVPIKDEPCKQS